MKYSVFLVPRTSVLRREISGLIKEFRFLMNCDNIV